MKLTGIFSPGTNSALANLGLLVLRVWIGLAMLLNHGWEKLTHFSEKAQTFPDPLHIGSTASLALCVFAEVVCSALVVVGLVTRFAAAIAVVNLTVAFVLVHQMNLGGEHPGELAFIYMAGFATLVIAGPGTSSADAALFAGKK